jgi:hypothetical protein
MYCGDFPTILAPRNEAEAGMKAAVGTLLLFLGTSIRRFGSC